MSDEDKRPPPEEIERRLAIARALLPESFRKFLTASAIEQGPREPEGEAWQWLTAILVADDTIFQRVEYLNARKQRGRPKVSAEDATHPPEMLVALAEAFNKFAARSRDDANRSGVPKPNESRLVASFRLKEGKNFNWLPKSDGTLLKLVQEGRRMRKWPRLLIKGRWRIVHPTQAAAYSALTKFPLQSDGDTTMAADAILSLRYDREGDLNEMATQQMIYVLRAHAIERLYGIPPVPGLKLQIEENHDD
jgi:hypothetical protein